VSTSVTATLSVTESGTDGFAGGPLYTFSFTNVSGGPPGSFVTAAAFNSVPVPATATLGVIIVPPIASVLVKTLKGITGDTGVIIAPAKPTLIAWPAAPPATLGITSSGIETLTFVWL
jgi:hypothetical protein